MGGLYNSEFVQIDAFLVDQVVGSGRNSLVLQAGSRLFNATLEHGEIPALERGSLVRITGLCSIEAENVQGYLVPKAFAITLRAADDIVVIRPAPMWNAGRLLRVVGGMVALMLAALTWVVVLRRRVRMQTAVIQSKLDQEQAHTEEISALNRRTIETLALAIEAKDQTTHDHLARVEVYAMAIGRELALSQDELQALETGALLHDLGKLAVPEYIISKPGRLTPEEFEKMKIHPVVGAELLEMVRFPYSVAPIVRAHHEKWDGSGYPNGLSGEDIPIGARILSAVDCLDARSVGPPISPCSTLGRSDVRR